MTLIFGIVFFVLAKWGFPMITGSVEKRAQRIGESIKAAKEAEDKLAAAQKAVKMASPEAVAFKVKFERIQQDLIDLRKDLNTIRQDNKQLGDGFALAVRKLLENQLADLEAGK